MVSDCVYIVEIFVLRVGGVVRLCKHRMDVSDGYVYWLIGGHFTSKDLTEV